jgi:hypothetical protein
MSEPISFSEQLCAWRQRRAARAAAQTAIGANDNLVPFRRRVDTSRRRAQREHALARLAAR